MLKRLLLLATLCLSTTTSQAYSMPVWDITTCPQTLTCNNEKASTATAVTCLLACCTIVGGCLMLDAATPARTAFTTSSLCLTAISCLASMASSTKPSYAAGYAGLEEDV